MRISWPVWLKRCFFVVIEGRAMTRIGGSTIPYLIYIFVLVVYLSVIVMEIFMAAEWFDVVKISLKDLLMPSVAAMSAFFAYLAYRREKRKLETEARPVLQVVECYPAIHENALHRLALKNWGTGPARNVKFSFCRLDRGDKFIPEKLFARRLESMFKFMKTGRVNRLGRYWVSALGAGCEERILWLYSREESGVNDVVIHGRCMCEVESVDLFHKTLRRISLRIEYESVYGEVWRYTWRSSGESLERKRLGLWFRED